MKSNYAKQLSSRIARHQALEKVMQSSPQTLRRRLVYYAIGMLSLPILFILVCILIAVGGILAGYFFSEIDERLWVLSLIAVGLAGMGVYKALNGLTAQYQTAPPRRILRADFPELFAFVEDTRRASGGPAIDTIVISPMLNAAVKEEWSSLLSRKPKYTLMIGLDLMEMQSIEEFRGTLAHEMGHLCARDTYYTSWLSRVLLCWESMMEGDNPRSTQFKSLAKIWSWFRESYSMIQWVVSRHAEIQADKIEVSVTSAHGAAQSLLRLAVYSIATAQDLARVVYLQKRVEPVPPSDIYQRRLQFLREPLPTEIEAEARRIAGSIVTTYEDSHPALRERLAALGVNDLESIVLDPVTDATRASTLLGAQYDTVVNQMALTYRQWIVEDWRRVFEAARREQIEFTELQAKVSGGSANEDDAWRLSQLEFQRADRRDIVPTFDKFIDLHPDHARARFLRGLNLLIQMREEGIEDVEFGMSREPALRGQGFEDLVEFLFKRGRYEEMVRIAERVDAFTDDRARAEKERESLAVSIPISAHKLTATKIKTLLAAARTHPRIRAVSVVLAHTKHLADEEFHLIVVEVEAEKGQEPYGVRYHISRELDFPHRTIVVPKDPRRWIERVREVPESAVYTRSD